MKFELYRARRGLLLRVQWRWRLRAKNGRIIAVSGEGYNNYASVLRSIDIVRNIAKNDVTVVEAGQ